MSLIVGLLVASQKPELGLLAKSTANVQYGSMGSPEYQRHLLSGQLRSGGYLELGPCPVSAVPCGLVAGPRLPGCAIFGMPFGGGAAAHWAVAAPVHEPGQAMLRWFLAPPLGGIGGTGFRVSRAAHGASATVI
ncbi:hypothetical protein ACQEVF_56665 [Nonomuraea polychroma]|uniref:hypothetical protein n=1 Tax=Nonomuraea polychroma TaxID=46176 RepID=UPI003D90BA4D